MRGPFRHERVVVVGRPLLHFIVPKSGGDFVGATRGFRELDQIRAAGFDRLREGARDEVLAVVTDSPQDPRERPRGIRGTVAIDEKTPELCVGLCELKQQRGHHLA